MNNLIQSYTQMKMVWVLAWKLSGSYNVFLQEILKLSTQIVKVINFSRDIFSNISP